MGTVYYPCGCSITTGMGDSDLVVSVHPCLQHVGNDNIQMALHLMADFIREIQDLPQED